MYYRTQVVRKSSSFFIFYIFVLQNEIKSVIKSLINLFKYNFKNDYYKKSSE